MNCKLTPYEDNPLYHHISCHVIPSLSTHCTTLPRKPRCTLCICPTFHKSGTPSVNRNGATSYKLKPSPVCSPFGNPAHSPIPAHSHLSTTLTAVFYLGDGYIGDAWGYAMNRKNTSIYLCTYGTPQSENKLGRKKKKKRTSVLRLE